MAQPDLNINLLVILVHDNIIAKGSISGLEAADLWHKHQDQSKHQKYQLLVHVNLNICLLRAKLPV